MTKQQFLDQLETGLKQQNIPDASDILEEYRQHFDFRLADGYSEEEIAARLGNPMALASQFTDASPSRRGCRVRLDRGGAVRGAPVRRVLLCPAGRLGGGNDRHQSQLRHTGRVPAGQPANRPADSANALLVRRSFGHRGRGLGSFGRHRVHLLLRVSPAAGPLLWPLPP